MIVSINTRKKKTSTYVKDVQGVIHKIQSTRFLLWVKFKLMRNTMTMTMFQVKRE